MKKRHKKKLLGKHGYKNFYKRVDRCKNINDWFKLIYSKSLSDLMGYDKNPILNLIKYQNKEKNPIILTGNGTFENYGKKD